MHVLLCTVGVEGEAMRIKLGHRYINLRWPLMRKSLHEKRIATLCEVHTYEEQRIEASVSKEREQLGQIIREFMELRGRRDLKTGRQYYVQVALDEMLIAHFFTPGDQQIVRLLAERIGRELEKEMLSVNFGRLFSRTDDEWVRIPANRPPYLP